MWYLCSHVKFIHSNHFFASAVETKAPKPEARKEKRAPKAPRDKPVISDVTDDSLRVTWQPAELPDFAQQTDILYSVERR